MQSRIGSQIATASDGAVVTLESAIRAQAKADIRFAVPALQGLALRYGNAPRDARERFIQLLRDMLPELTPGQRALIVQSLALALASSAIRPPRDFRADDAYAPPAGVFDAYHAIWRLACEQAETMPPEERRRMTEAFWLADEELGKAAVIRFMPDQQMEDAPSGQEWERAVQQARDDLKARRYVDVPLTS